MRANENVGCAGDSWEFMIGAAGTPLQHGACYADVVATFVAESENVEVAISSDQDEPGSDEAWFFSDVAICTGYEHMECTPLKGNGLYSLRPLTKDTWNEFHGTGAAVEGDGAAAHLHLVGALTAPVLAALAVMVAMVV